MIRPLPLAIGLRYFRAKRRDGFMSLVAWISLLGMMLGVLSLLVVMSVMNGFEAELRGRILTVVPHGYLIGPNDTLDDWPTWQKKVLEDERVTGAAPYIGGQAMLLANEETRGAQLWAVDPDAESSVSAVPDRITYGRFLRPEIGGFEIVLGEILARQLNVIPGDKVTVVLPKVTVTPLGIFPRQKDFTLVGTFEVGAQIDANTVFIHIRDGRKLYQMGESVQGLRLEVDDLFNAHGILSDQLTRLPKGADVKSWSQTQGSLFTAVKMEKTIIRLLLMFIVLIAAFNIISVLTLSVSEKRSAIAVLRTQGASRASILAIFVVYGMSTGVLGVLLGLGLGIPLALNVGAVAKFLEESLGFYFFDPSVYFITRIPSEVHWPEVGAVALAALLLSFLATLYPAWRACGISPAEALRYE